MKTILIPAILVMVLSAAGCGGGESAGSDDAAVTEEAAESDEAAGEIESVTDSDPEQASSSDAEIVQGRSMMDIRLKLDEINQVLKPAYEELLENDPAASGLIEISFSITPDGSVTDVVVTPDESLAALATLVEESVSAMAFEASLEQEENIPVTVPIYLVPPE